MSLAENTDLNELPFWNMYKVKKVPYIRGQDNRSRKEEAAERCR